jgi:FkbM family methyltransferase
LVEPQIEMRPHLEAFCAENPKARWIQAGAGPCEGELAFTVRPDTVSSSFMETDDDAMRFNWERRTVQLVTLDSLCQQVVRGIPEMVKLDAEGFEREIMKGAGSLIGKTELFFLEAALFAPRQGAPDFVETIQLMADYGYVPYDFTEFGFRPYDQALGLCEIAFARRHGVLRSYLGWAGESLRSAA